MFRLAFLMIGAVTCIAQSQSIGKTVVPRPEPSPTDTQTSTERLRLEQDKLAFQRDRLEFERSQRDVGLTPITIALFGGFVTGIGWLVSSFLSARSTRRSLKDTASLKHIERQLEELYGPLAFLILEGRQTFQELLESLGRNYVFEGSRELPPDELKTWIFWVENDFFPRNEKIKTLLSTKTHLLDAVGIPRSYQAFLDHHNSWYINHVRWKQDKTVYGWHSKMNFPEEFAPDVLSAFAAIKARHIELIGQRQTRDAQLGTSFKQDQSKP